MNGDLLNSLASAQSQEERTWLVTESLIATMPTDLRAMTWAAAVPHWFNADILAALRPELRKRASQLYLDMQTLSFVEAFPERGHDIHELTRKVLLDHLWHDNRDEFRVLSGRVADFLARRDEIQARIERVYHLLVANQDEGSDAFMKLAEDLNKSFRLAELESLVNISEEHVHVNRIAGRARASVLDRKLELNKKAVDTFGFESSELPSQSSQLIIEHFPNSEYRISWYLSNQIVIPTETIRTLQEFDKVDWRTRTKEIGTAVFRDLLPNRAQEFMRAHQDWAIQLTTNWPQIPWELLYDGNEFICLSRPIARKPRLLKEPRVLQRPQRKPYRALVVGNPTGDLEGAEAEAMAVANVLEGKGFLVDRLIGREAAKATEFLIRISTQPYLLIHFAGHGYFNRTAPQSSELQFSDTPFLAEELERVMQTRVFLFLSVSELKEGKTQASQARVRGEFMEGFAVSALVGGALGCLGPIWEIEDGLAKEFAVEFYDHILNGNPIGEAVRKARLDRQSANSDLWASWVLYGDPLQSLITA